MGDAPVQLKAGPLLGFGKHKWKARKPGEDFNVEKEILFQLMDSTDLVMVGNALLDLQTVLEQRQKTHPASKINYHELVMKPPEEAGKPGAFTPGPRPDV